MKYLWTEDTGAGLHFWKLVNQLFFNDALVVESKESNASISLHFLLLEMIDCFICFIWIRNIVQSFLVCYFNGEDLKIRKNSFTISFNSCISSEYRSPVLFTFFVI